jgi:type IV pilus assembly protein PilV
MQTVKFKKPETGTSLIEVLVTLLIFAVGLLGFAGLQVNALQSTSDSAQRSQAVWINQELAERMRANPEANNAAYTGVAANCSNLPAPMCSDYFDPVTATKINATECTAAQVAAFDIWEAQCSYSSVVAYQANAAAANGRYSSRDFLSRPAGATPAIGLAANGTRLTITTNWLSKGTRTAAGEAQSNSLEIQR